MGFPILSVLSRSENKKVDRKRSGLLGFFGDKTLRAWSLWVPLLVAFLEGLTHFGKLYGDSNGYIFILRVFRGVASPEEGAVVGWHGILRPVVPVLAVPLSFLFGYRDSIAIVNLALLLAGTVVVYVFVEKLFDSQLATISAILFATSVPVLVYSVAVLTDGAGYTFLVFGIVAILFWVEERGFGSWLLVGALVGVAMLAKETTVVLFIFLLIRLIEKRSMKQLKLTIVVAAIGLLLAGVWSIAIGYNYFQFYQAGLVFHGVGYKGALVNPREFLISLVHAFYFVLPFAFIGFFKVDNKRFKVLLEIFISVLPLLMLWPTLPEGRFAFLLFPAMLPLASVGLAEASASLGERPLLGKIQAKYWLFLFVLAIVVFNNYATFARYARFAWSSG